MKRAILFVLILALSPFAVAQDPPKDVGQEEQVEVNLVLIETLVLDKKGNTITGLTQDDFRLSVQGQNQQIDTFDGSCPGGEMADPTGLKSGEQREVGPAPTQMRKMVFVLDYYHLPLTDRAWVMSQVKAMIARGKTVGEEVMVVALADGLRVEQRFTTDKWEVLDTLERMEHDKSLWAREFQPLTDRSFFDNLAMLMDLLTFHDGSKAIMLFSGFYGSSDSQDLWYQEVAERAPAARAAIYPADIHGLTTGGPVGGSPSMGRLANESGGRMTERTDDLSLAYARAQHDLACRYTLGFYVQAGEGRKRRQVRVSVEGKGVVRAPEWVQVADEKDRRDSMMRAAFADPGTFENPLIRLASMPLRSASAKSWDTITVLHFPIPVEDGSIGVDVNATLSRKGTILRKFSKSFDVAPKAGLSGNDRSVTIFSESDMKPGRYTLTTVLSRSELEDSAHSMSTEITVPEIPDGLFVTGPLMARKVDDGVLLRATKKGFEEVENTGALRDIVGPDGSFEPLVVLSIESDDTLLAAWSVCTADGKWKAPAGATIERTLVGRDGSGEAYRFESLALALPPKGKSRCQSALDSIPPGTLDPRRYFMNIIVQDTEGEVITRGLVPLLVE